MAVSYLNLDTSLFGTVGVAVSDANNDGWVDAIFLDLDSNGRYDVSLADTNGDHHLDTIYQDANGDGQPETQIYQISTGLVINHIDPFF